MKRTAYRVLLNKHVQHTPSLLNYDLTALYRRPGATTNSGGLSLVEVLFCSLSRAPYNTTLCTELPFHLAF